MKVKELINVLGSLSDEQKDLDVLFETIENGSVIASYGVDNVEVNQPSYIRMQSVD